MILQYYVVESATGKPCNIEIDAASKEDLEATKNGWQTNWNVTTSRTLAHGPWLRCIRTAPKRL